MSEPTSLVLTPGQVELIEEMLEDRAAYLKQEVQTMINVAMDALRQDFKADIVALRQEMDARFAETVQYGQRVGLRAGNTRTLAAIQNDLSQEVDAIRWEWGNEVGPWESFTVERSQE